MLLALEGGAVPVLEDLGKAVKVLLLEAVELDDGGRVALQDAHLVALGGAAPLGAADVVVVEGEGVAAAGGLPAEAVLGEATLSALLGEVEVDVVEALAVCGRGVLVSQTCYFLRVEGKFGGATHMAVILR